MADHELKKIEDVVRMVLTNFPETRNSDNILYAKVIGVYNKKALNAPAVDFFNFFMDLDIPRFESVARCRRKLQEDNIELRATENIHKWRKENEKKFEAYAKGE